MTPPTTEHDTISQVVTDPFPGSRASKYNLARASGASPGSNPGHVPQSVHSNMTSQTANYDEMLTHGNVDDGTWISMFWDGEEWLVASQSLIPSHVHAALNDLFVSKLDLPDRNEIEDKYDVSQRLNPDVQLIDLDEWLEDPETGTDGQVLINEVALIEEDDDEWIVNPTPRDQLQVTV